MPTNSACTTTGVPTTMHELVTGAEFPGVDASEGTKSMAVTASVGIFFDKAESCYPQFLKRVAGVANRHVSDAYLRDKLFDRILDALIKRHATINLDTVFGYVRKVAGRQAGQLRGRRSAQGDEEVGEQAEPRKHRPRVVSVSDFDALSETVQSMTPTPYRVIVSREAQNMVDSILARIPDDERKLIRLTAEVGPREAARTLGIPESTVRSRCLVYLRKARASLHGGPASNWV